MEPKPRFVVSKLSDAAFLEGVKRLRCEELVFDEESPNRVLFVFSIDQKEGEQMILEFGSSQAFAFDSSVKNLKGRLFSKLRERGTK
jgi:hypothetical protein